MPDLDSWVEKLGLGCNIEEGIPQTLGGVSSGTVDTQAPDMVHIPLSNLEDCVTLTLHDALNLQERWGKAEATEVSGDVLGERCCELGWDILTYRCLI